MNREERQIHTYIERFKRHIQDHLHFKPMALSNFHHMSDRLLDKKDGCFRLFKKNLKDMIRDVLPDTVHGDYVIERLKAFAASKSCTLQDFVEAVEDIYRSGRGG